MKIAILFLVGLSLSYGSTFVLERHMVKTNHVGTQTLDDLLKQFADFIPYDECKAIVDGYIATDADVQEAWAFLQSDEFKSLADKITSMQEYKDFVQYLADSGMDIYTYINIVRKFFGLPPIYPPTHLMSVRAESGIILMIKDLLAVLPIEDINTWFYNVCLPDPDFAAFIERIQSPEFLKIVQTVVNSPEYKDMTDIMRAQGIDVDKIEQVIRDWLEGNKVAPQTLDDLLKQFAAFIPFPKCLEVVNKYLANNADVQQAWAFLTSDEFENLVKKIDAMPEYQDFVQYLYDSGLDIYTYINIIHEMLGLPPVTPPPTHLRGFRMGESGIITMINEILALLPIEDIKNWFNTVCVNDPDYQALLVRLRSPEFKKLVDLVYNSPEYKTMTDILLSQGIDVAAIEKVIRDFFNFSKVGPQTLDDLLKQFAAFIPFPKCLEVVNKYMANNADVQQAWAFLTSDEFENLVKKVDAMPEYIAFVQYLYDSGLDIYTYINIIHEMLGLPPVTPPPTHLRGFRMGESGIITMINEILALLPIEDIKNWYNTVCVNDPDYQALLVRLRSPEFKKLVDLVYNSPEYKTMTDILLSQGIDVAAIEKVIRDFFNFSMVGPQTLDDLLKQFAAFIPFPKCLEVVNKYMANNADVQQAWAFLTSDEFENLVKKVDAMPEYIAFVQYLYDSGLDIYTYINIIHEMLGLPPVTPPPTHLRGFRMGESGIITMINEILALLPIEDIKNWYNTVCVNDPDYQALLVRLRSPEFKKLVDLVYNSPEYKTMTDILLSQGIDVAAIEKVIRDFFNFSKVGPQTLDDLLKQFAAFIPFPKCLEVVNKYMANNADVQQAWAFLTSDEFENLVKKVDAMPEYIAFVQYLYDSGLDIYTYINIIHEMLGLPPVTPPPTHLRGFRMGESGIITMINEILALLPIEDIKNWYNTVCVNDPDYQALLVRLRSPEFKKLVDLVYNSPEYKTMTDILLSQGIDVAAIEKVIRDFFNFSKVGPQTLDDLLKQFAAFIPFPKCLEVVNKYMANNADVQQAWAFLTSDEFENLVKKVDAMPEYIAFVQYLYDSGLDIYTYINIIHEMLGLPPVTPPPTHLRGLRMGESGIITMINEILALLPIEDIKNWYNTVCVNDPDYQALLVRLRSPEFKKLVDLVYNSPEYKTMTDILLSQGIDVAAIEKVIRDFFNFSMVGPQTLDDLLKQFAAFIPFPKCLEVVNKYMANNADVQQAWAFLTSDEFENLVKKVDAMPEYIAFVQYLYDSGLDIYTYINIIHEMLGLPPVTPPPTHLRGLRMGESGIITMINEILALLPIEDIKNWYNTVCVNDPDYQALLVRLRSPEFKKLVDLVYNSPEYKTMTDILLSQGIDVAAIEKVIRDFFNFSMVGPQTLDDLLKQFAAFIPFPKCLEVVNKYMANNADVQQAWAFLTSDEFENLVKKVDAMPEYIAFVQYLYDSGLDIYTYINIIHEMLGLPPVTPPPTHLRGFRMGESGIILMINEILALLPIEDIKNWYNTVCVNDPDYQALLVRLRSPEFKKLVDLVYNSPEYKTMTDILLSQGIDVAAIEKVIRDFFNFSMVGPQTLDDLLKQFAAFIPFPKCLEVVNKYMANNADVQQAWAFLTSDEFENLVKKVDAMPEYIAFVQYLYDSGLDIYTYINIIHEMLGLPPVTPPPTHLRGFRMGESGIILMINEILALLPIEDIKNWYNTVCVNDPDYQALLVRLRSPEFKKLVDLVYNSPEYKTMTDILLSQGIDVAAIEKVIRDFFNFSMVGPQTLDDLLKQFAAFIPFPKCLEVVNKYMANNADVQQAWAFLTSDEFENLVKKVDAMPEYIAFVQYLYDSGLDIYTYINIIHEMLGLPPVTPPPTHLRGFRMGESGIILMINEILALLPIEDIKNWYNTVCVNDPDYQALLVRLRSPEFKKLVDLVYNSPEYKTMTDILLSQGIDVAAIEKIIRDFFNWGRINYFM